MSLDGITAYGVYRALARPGDLPKEAAEALSLLRRFAAKNGGQIRRSDLQEIEDPLARSVAETAMNHKGVTERLGRGLPVPYEKQADLLRYFSGNLLALRKGVRATNVALDAAEIDRDWFAAYFARRMTVEAWNSDKGVFGGPPTTTDALLAAMPELVKLRALQADIDRLPPGDLKDELIRVRTQTLKDALMSACFSKTDPASMARAATKLGGKAEGLYETLLERGRNDPDPLGDSPEIPAHLLGRLDGRALYGLRVSAASDQQLELGKLPVLRDTAKTLVEMGLLDSQTFSGIEVGVRTHALPSLAQLLDLCSHFGGLRHLDVLGKGVSTSPLTMVGIMRAAQRASGGHGDSRLSPSQHAKALADEVGEWMSHAGAAKRPLLVLGDGGDSARAVHEACGRDPDVPVAYVEFTQSGMNFLRDVDELRCVVESFADSPLKKISESQPLGDWLVGHEVKLLLDEGRDPKQMTAVVVGYGASVGPGVAKALREAKFKDVLVVDTDPARRAQAEADGFTAVAPDPSGALPAASSYFSCVGRPGVIDERALRSMPDDSTVINCASRNEVDEDWLHRARTRKIKDVRAHALEKKKLPEHQTLVVELGRPPASRVRVRKVGQPFFDGVRDKDKKLVDIYMAGLLASMCLAARRLKAAQQEGGALDRSIKTLDRDVQLAIVGHVEQHYGEKLDTLRAALAPEQ